MNTSNFTNNVDQFKLRGNGSHEGPERPAWYNGVRIALASLSVFGNGFLIILILSRRQLRKRSQNWLILSLAFADLFVGAFNTPAQLICTTSLQCTWQQWEIISACSSVFLNASITNLTLLMLDRYIAVVHPFLYLRFSEKSVTAVLISLAWWCAAILGVVYVALSSVLASKDGYYISFFILLTFVPNGFMLYAFIRVLIVVRRHRIQITRQERQVNSNRDHPSPGQQPGNRSRPRGLLAAVGVIVVIFLICNGFYQYWLLYKVMKLSTSVVMSLVMVVLRYFNSAPNFIIYVLLKRDIRQEVRNIFCKTQS